MICLSKIGFAKTKHGGAIKLGVTADIIILARSVTATCLVLPMVLGFVPGLDEHCFGVGILRLLRQEISPLEDQHFGTGSGHLTSHSTTSDARSDNHDVWFDWYRHTARLR